MHPSSVSLTRVGRSKVSENFPNDQGRKRVQKLFSFRSTNTPLMLKVDVYWDLRAPMPERHTGVGKHVIAVLCGLNASSEIDLRVLAGFDPVVT
jgi:hypothetical protein